MSQQDTKAILLSAFQTLEGLEWIKYGDCLMCPSCHGKKPRQPNVMAMEAGLGYIGHRKTCPVSISLREIGAWLQENP